MELATFLSLTFATITAAIAVLHFYWAAGGRKGRSSAIPTRDGQPLFEPSPLVTTFVGVALLLAATVALEYTDILNLPLPAWMTRLGMWVLGAVFLLRAIGDFSYAGFFKRHTDTRFAKLDTLFYSPLCLLLALLVFGTLFATLSLPV